MPEVTYKPLVNMRQRPLNPTTAQSIAEKLRVDAMLKAGLIRENASSGMVVVANAYSWERDFNQIANRVNDGNAKMWWARDAIEVVTIAHNPDGTFRTVENTGGSLPQYELLGRELSDFYKKYRRQLPLIPDFVLKSYTAEESQRRQFGEGPAEPLPLARYVRRDGGLTRDTFMPQTIAYKVMDDGSISWFSRREYEDAYPVDRDIQVAPPIVEDAMIIAGVEDILALRISDKEKVSQLVAMFGRMRGTSVGYTPQGFEVRA